MNRPVLYAIAATALMLLIALPALSLKLGTGAIAQLPKDFETAQGIAARRPGGRRRARGGPVQVVADFGNGPVDAGRRSSSSPRPCRSCPDVAAVGKPVIVARRAPGAGRGHARPTTRRATRRTRSCKRIRVGPAALLQGANVNVGGAAAQDHDFTDLISGSLWKVAVFVLLFSYLVLLLRDALGRPAAEGRR